MSALSSQELDHWIEKIVRRVEETAKLNLKSFPHYSDDFGRWVVTHDGDWTGGFWVGLLWLSHVYTQEEKFLKWAEEWMRKLQPRANSETVFRCFLFYYGAAIGDLLVGHEEAANIAVTGAKGLATMYNPSARVIPLGPSAEEASSVGYGETNVDGVMSVALLSYAVQKTGEDKLKEIGVNHALTHISYCVLEDGAVIQSASFDPETGELLRRYTHKGYGDDTVWARAQAWAMIGYTQAARWVPENPQFLQTAIKVTEWWINKVPSDLVAFWDFNDPWIPNTLKDTSATAIAAAAMFKLSNLVFEERLRNKFYSFAVKTLEALTKYITPSHAGDKRPVGMLTSGCYNRRISLATNNELIWGNYYLLESLLTLKNPKIVKI